MGENEVVISQTFGIVLSLRCIKQNKWMKIRGTSSYFNQSTIINKIDKETRNAFN